MAPQYSEASREAIGRSAVAIVAGEVELGYQVRPEQGSAPGIALIPDVWGLYDHYRELAQRLAEAGFSALALDLYRRLPEVKIEDPGRWIRALDDREVLGDVQAAVDFLRAQGSRRVGVTGFCMGGMYALLAAADCTELSAAVAFYGMLSDEHGLLAPVAGEVVDPARKPHTPLEVAAALRCPTLACFGADDAFIPIADVRRFEARLAAEHRVVVYPGAGHAFLNDTRPAMYRPEAARDAWSRMLAWFHRYLDT
jgi:carboxymethylenebutenolidase